MSKANNDIEANNNNLKSTASAPANGYLSPIQRTTSDGYRAYSCGARTQTDSEYGVHYQSAHALSASAGIDFHSAMERIAPEWEEKKWESIEPEKDDSKVGDTITTKKLRVTCNSLLQEMFNDTIGVFFDAEKNEWVTYSAMESAVMKHSGDKIIPYGLRHIMSFDPSKVEGMVGYIVSAPWVQSRPRPIAELASTNPIFEVCTDDDGVLKRHIIPQDFMDGGDKTACVNAMVKFTDGLWHVTFMRDFVNGFASDMKTLVTDLRQLAGMPAIEFAQPSLGYGGGFPYPIWEDFDDELDLAPAAAAGAVGAAGAAAGAAAFVCRESQKALSPQKGKDVFAEILAAAPPQIEGTYRALSDAPVGPTHAEMKGEDSVHLAAEFPQIEGTYRALSDAHVGPNDVEGKRSYVSILADLPPLMPFDEPSDFAAAAAGGGAAAHALSKHGKFPMPLSSFMMLLDEEGKQSREYTKLPVDPRCTCGKIYNFYFPEPCECTDDMRHRGKCCQSCNLTQSRSCHRDCPVNGGKKQAHQFPTYYKGKDAMYMVYGGGHSHG